MLLIYLQVGPGGLNETFDIEKRDLTARCLDGDAFKVERRNDHVGDSDASRPSAEHEDALIFELSLRDLERVVQSCQDHAACALSLLLTLRELSSEVCQHE